MMTAKEVHPASVPPPRQAAGGATAAADASIPLVLDTRPIFSRGETPCAAIDEAVASVATGQKFILIAPFEPIPLYAKLGAKGFQHTTHREPDGAFRLEFLKPS